VADATGADDAGAIGAGELAADALADALADVLADVAALDPQAARLRTAAPASAAAAIIFFMIWFSLVPPQAREAGMSGLYQRRNS
jgi:hypothetical protein